MFHDFMAHFDIHSHEKGDEGDEVWDLIDKWLMPLIFTEDRTDICSKTIYNIKKNIELSF